VHAEVMTKGKKVLPESENMFSAADQKKIQCKTYL
jgi:hypothetical protein